MKFDLWTWLFQIINFGVLLWILKRILYQPVREIMEQRRALAVKKLEDAENIRKEAEELLVKYQEEQKELAAQRTRLLEEMKVEAAQERQNLLADANREVQRQIEKGRALYEAEKERHKNEFKEQAVTSVELFSRQLLASIADHELHLAMIRKFKSALDEFVADLKDETGADGELNLRIASACQLSEEDENNLRQELEKRLGCRIKLAVAEDSDLIAGIKVFSGDKSYDASLSGQLAAFSKKIRAPI